ncbi:MAG: hypothetical protein Q8R47_02510 [Nanoarchaeota archaeon]|nr:hypothetical protein [Nanoarchaeota archaeon]
MSQKGDKKKPKTVEEIIADYQKYHHKAGKEFKDRIKKFEEFYDPESIHGAVFAHHAHYTIFGRPGKEKDYPGAFNEAYKKLDKHVKEDDEKLEDEDKLAEILDTYADTFLQQAMGSGFKKAMDHAQKENKMDKKELRELKGQFMGQFHFDDEGNPQNILSDSYIKRLKGKKKVELIDELKNMSERVKKSYNIFLNKKALEGILSEEDRTDMAKYLTPIFEERGFKHKKTHIMRSVGEQQAHYGALLAGNPENSLQQAGYKAIKYQKKEKDKK